MRDRTALCQAMRYLKQKAQRAEASRVKHEEMKTENHRRAAEFDARMLICAATDMVRYWEEDKMPPLSELLARENQDTAAAAAGEIR